MINTFAIRCSILRLAFSGNLTVQAEEDGTAIELLDRINPKKSIMQSENIPYSIPDSWAWVKLSDLYKVNPKVEADGTTEAAFIPMERISGGFNRAFTHEIQSWERASKNHTKFADGDVAFAKITPCFENRKSFIAENLPNGIGGGTTELIILRQKEMLPAYTYFLVLDQRFIATGTASYKGTVGQQRVQSDVIKNYLVPVAPYAEQKRIVEKIDQAFSVLDTIDSLQAQYADNLTALKAKLIDAAIQGKLTEQLPEDGSVEELYARVQKDKTNILRERKGRADKNIKEVGDDVPYDIPAHWKWIRFGELGLFKKGPFGSALTKSMFVPKSSDTVKVYEQQHAIKKDPTLGTYYITKEYFDEKMNGFEVKSGDILISCAGTIGETYVMPDDIEQGIINQALIRVTLVPGINKRFFQYYFDSSLKSSARAGNGSTIVNIPPFDVIKNWYFPLAPIEEQERIVARLEEVFAEMKM
ncbi:MAG: restriction endonuclease subunit S [Blautia sp.]|nr:restriction endonuclease subunit S [Blautia sp.]